MVKLGSKVRDSISGFNGIATARTEHLYGCTRITIEPDKLGEHGKTITSEWFDEQRIEVIEEREPTVSPASSALSGGPQKETVRTPDPPAR